MNPINVVGTDRIIPVAQIFPNSWNPNEMDPNQFARLKHEIKTSGFSRDKRVLVRVKPLPEDQKYEEGAEDFEIIDGEHRWRAGKELGMKEIPCVVMNIPELDEASFRTYILNNLRGNINEVKLAVLIQAWQKSGLAERTIYDRTGIRIHKQKQLLEKLRPANLSKEVMKGHGGGSHKSFAVILSIEEFEIVKRAVKLTRLRGEAEAFIEIVDYYLSNGELTLDQEDKIKKLLQEAKDQTNAKALIELCSFYLKNVKKEEIRR